MCGAISGSLLLRISMFDFESGDYRRFLSRWYDHFVEHGRWHGLGEFAEQLPSYCYPPFYLYLISLSTLLPLPKLYAIKLISVAMDYLAAAYVGRLARREFSSDHRSWRYRRCERWTVVPFDRIGELQPGAFTLATTIHSWS